ncbi:MAG TPA: hypothetical protein PK781_03865 [Terrimesophilobacter sp.]|nr:hypothetical protein [Terrimesophilobacter sp.]
MRKFLFSGSVISALFSGLGAVKATRSGPRDWRLAAMWIAWALTLAIAIGTVIEDNKHPELEESDN